MGTHFNVHITVRTAEEAGRLLMELRDRAERVNVYALEGGRERPVAHNELGEILEAAGAARRT